MADVVYTLKADVKRAANTAVVGKGEGANMKRVTVTKSVTARTQNDTMKLLRLPTNARLDGGSTVYFDDLSSGSTATLAIGIGSVDANFTGSATALNSSIDIHTAASNAKVVGAIANYGKMLWEILSLASDPGGFADIYVTFTAAATETTGTLCADFSFTFD